MKARYFIISTFLLSLALGTSGCGGIIDIDPVSDAGQDGTADGNTDGADGSGDGFICGDLYCNPSETCQTCPQDCGACDPICGDDQCETAEDCESCPADCGICGPYCPNGQCETGEDCSSCEADCGPCGPVCDNGQCETGEDCSSCEADCGPCALVCGDGHCHPEENPWHCSSDCGTPEIPAGFAGVVWLHTNVSGWAQTANLSPVSVGGGQICLPYDKANTWPGVDHVDAFVNANPWVFIYQDGVLYGATWEWMRHGQTCKNSSSVAGDHIKQDPLWQFAPQSGHWYGFMVSGLARDSVRNVQERSNAVLLQWP